MPHSSGGGSHHGGSHHSSSHSGGGRSTSGISRSPYPGARRYRLTRRGQTRYFYSNREPGKLQPGRLLIGIIYLPFIIMSMVMMGTALKPMPSNYDTAIVIKDEAGVLGDEAPLSDALSGFYAKTGITPAVITVHNEVWEGYGDLESYAYDRYLAEFDDEMHWLIVYSEPEQPDPDFVDWYWEGMQGDDTDEILTTGLTGRFNADVQTSLNNSDGVTNALTDAFRRVTELAQKPSLLKKLAKCAPALFVLAFVAFHAYFMLGLYELKYRKAELVLDGEENSPYLDADTYSYGGTDENYGNYNNYD